MTKHADELEQLVGRHQAINQQIAGIEKKLNELSMQRLSSSALESLKELKVDQGVYFSAEMFESYVSEDKALKQNVQDLNGRVLDNQIANDQNHQKLVSMQSQLSHDEEENKRFKEEQANSKARFEKINETLFTLLSEKQKKSAELLQTSNPNDWAIVSVSKQLQFGQIKPGAVKALLTTKLSDEDSSPLLSDYVQLKQESHGYFSPYKNSLVFTGIGEQLKAKVDSYAQRLQKFQQTHTSAVEEIKISFAEKEQELKKIETEIELCQQSFTKAKESVIGHFSESKKSAEAVLAKINEAKRNIDQAQPQPQNPVPVITSLLESKKNVAGLQVEAKQLEKSIQKIEEGCKLQKAYLLLANQELKDAEADCQQSQLLFGEAGSWKGLLKTINKIRKEQAALLTSVKEQEDTLKTLREQKVLADQQIEQLQRQAEEARQAAAEEAQVEEKQRLAAERERPAAQQVEEDKNVSETTLVIRYRTATSAYLEDLGTDITNRLKKLQQSYEKAKANHDPALAEHPYNQLLSTVGSNPAHNLKKLFEEDKDNNAGALSMRETVKKILTGPKQEPLKDALDKYGLVTKLQKSLDSGTNAFHDLLYDKKNQSILFKHRDQSLYAFIHACGAFVKNIFRGSFKKIYYDGTFFPSGGKRYAAHIKKIDESELVSKRRKLSVS